MTGSTGGNLSKNLNSMKKLNFKEKKYVLPLLALPFLLLFAYVGAGFTQRSSLKINPKNSLSESKDSIMSKNDAYDAFFKKRITEQCWKGLTKRRIVYYTMKTSYH
jgi:hypothetical protein